MVYRVCRRQPVSVFLYKFLPLRDGATQIYSGGKMKPNTLFVILALALTGCSKPVAVVSSSPVLDVRVAVAIQTNRTSTEIILGTVRPKLSTTIESKVTGRITEVLVSPGQSVKQGDLLLTISASELQAQLNQATATRQQAANDLKRATELNQQQIMSQAEFDNAQSKFQVAEAAEVAAQTMWDYTKLKAPFDGVITKKLADVGDLATPGRILLQMENPQTLRIEADLPESLVNQVKLRDKLKVLVPGLPAMNGTTTEISPVADDNSRTYLIKLDLPVQIGIKSGQFGRLEVPTGQVQVLQIPVNAIIHRGQLEMVYTITDHRASLRLIKTGRTEEGSIEVNTGLNSGEQVITSEIEDLTDGQTVRILP